MIIEKEFAPTTIRLETKEELKEFKDMLLDAFNYHHDAAFRWHMGSNAKQKRSDNLAFNILERLK